MLVHCWVLDSVLYSMQIQTQQPDKVHVLQEEASMLKHPTVTSFLKHVRKATQANKPV